MGEGYSLVDKIKARKRMLDAAFSGNAENSAASPAPAPVVGPKGTKRVPYRDPATQKIFWKDVPE
jgi:hypothetical protein